ncbi:hypothetical protein [Brucella pseudogrignonensis]|uniref:Lipopolysaccharide biosynthesis protein n=1 Tax=Brucella pseudogrignonensis TaxID=419475 RepID=A0ABU1MF64_9HYPH|nr:hypothetical protein [Brucella pseudogrignonensis]MDR6434672.1 hypothetical protein [Brucella pseudogrignonensis]
MSFINFFTNGLGSLKNKHKNSRVFILANGPSVVDFPLNLLEGEIVIGMNASTILNERFGFCSKYHVISDQRFLAAPEKAQWGTTKLNPNTIRVLRRDLIDFDDQNITNKTHYVAPLSRDGFSKNLAHGFYYGCTTTMLALQLAWHLGSREVFLLGCDLRYPDENPRFYEEAEPQLEDSFISVQASNIVNAAGFFEDAGGVVVNCSSSSFLRPYLPYRQFESLFSSDIGSRLNKRRSRAKNKVQDVLS